MFKTVHAICKLNNGSLQTACRNQLICICSSVSRKLSRKQLFFSEKWLQKEKGFVGLFLFLSDFQCAEFEYKNYFSNCPANSIWSEVQAGFLLEYHQSHCLQWACKCAKVPISDSIFLWLSRIWFSHFLFSVSPTKPTQLCQCMVISLWI